MEVAQEVGVHLSTVYRWKKRATRPNGQLGVYKAKRKSTRPRSIRYKLQGKDLERLLALRNKYGWTAEKLQYVLKLKVSVRTMQRALKRHRLVRESNYYRRPRLQPTIHMHLKNTTAVGYLQTDKKLPSSAYH
mgnify:FL=1